MNEIKISLQEVNDTAERIAALNEDMYERLCAMKQEMNSLGGTWISDGSEEIRNRFNMFAARFEKQREDIASYSKFLKLTVQSYDTLETTITGNAAGIEN